MCSDFINCPFKTAGKGYGIAAVTHEIIRPVIAPPPAQTLGPTAGSLRVEVFRKETLANRHPHYPIGPVRSEPPATRASHNFAVHLPS